MGKRKDNIKSKAHWICLLVFLLFCSCSSDHSDYEVRFENKTLRMDYLHTGSKDESLVEFLSLSAEPFWGGSKWNLIDDPLKGEFVIQVFDIADDELIYKAASIRNNLTDIKGSTLDSY
ncbi:MAG: hypothetical protein K9N21_23365 [Deltaproteobacteria bacterium]|nr:hypothetical protein [Deltaproteobacteria bacterium]